MSAMTLIMILLNCYNEFIINDDLYEYNICYIQYLCSATFFLFLILIFMIDILID